jgi:hypothetical protein
MEFKQEQENLTGLEDLSGLANFRKKAPSTFSN